MKFGIRTPSLRKSIAARTSVKRMVRQSLGLKAPRGYGWLTNPKKAAYNRVYSRTSVSLWSILESSFDERASGGSGSRAGCVRGSAVNPEAGDAEKRQHFFRVALSTFAHASDFVVLTVLGILLVWGSPAVVVDTAGRDLNAAKGWPWTRGEANAFVDALRGQLFNR